MPQIPPRSRLARRQPASSTMVIRLPTPPINHSISDDAFPFARRSAKLESQSSLLILFAMPVLDTLALAALESARALTSYLSPRSDSNNPFGRHCDNGVVLQLRHAPSTRRLGPRPKLTTVPMIIGLPPFFAQSESTWTSILHLVILRLSLRPIVLTSPPSRILLALELTSSLAVLPCPRTSSAGSAFTVPLSIDTHPGHFVVHSKRSKSSCVTCSLCGLPNEPFSFQICCVIFVHHHHFAFQAHTVPHTHKSPSRKKRSMQHAGQWWKEVPARANPARGEHSLLAPGRWPSSTAQSLQ